MKTTKPLRRQVNRQTGQGLIEYAILLLFASATVALAAALIGPSVGDVFSRVVNTMQEEEKAPATELTVTVLDEAGQAVDNQYVYLFNGDGDYLGEYGRTDANGRVTFEQLTAGSYRALVLNQMQRRYQLHWSSPVSFPQQGTVTVKLTSHRVTVRVVDAAGEGIPDAYVYAFTVDHRYYAGVGGRTNDNGEVTLSVPQGEYAFRAYHRGHLYWSEATSVPERETAVIQTNQAAFTVSVVDDEARVTGRVRVHLFSGQGYYLGESKRTDRDGVVTFNLPQGRYRFRADYRGQAFWSDTVDTGTSSQVTISVSRR